MKVRKAGNIHNSVLVMSVCCLIITNMTKFVPVAILDFFSFFEMPQSENSTPPVCHILYHAKRGRSQNVPLLPDYRCI